MAESSFGQHFITCDNCDQNPASYFCKTCIGNLCENCKTEHKEKKISKRHDVQPITLTSELEASVSNFCLEHEEYKYELCCKNCEVPVCTKCVAGTHNGHIMAELSSAFLAAKENLSSDISEIEDSIIPWHAQISNEIDEDIHEIDKESERIDHALEKQFDALVESMKTILQKRKEKIFNIKTQNKSKLQMAKNMLEKDIENFHTAKAKLEAIRRSQSVSEVFLYKKEIPKIHVKQNVNPMILHLPSFRMEKFDENVIESLFGEIEMSTFAKRYTDSRQPFKEFIDTPFTINTFPSGVKGPRGVHCVRSDYVWIRGSERNLKMFDEHGHKLNKIPTTTTLGQPSGMIAKDKDIVIYSDIDNKRIMMVLNSNQTVLVKTDWYPMGLCMSNSDGFLCCMAFQPWDENEKPDCGKIVRFDFAGNVQHEIQDDGDKKLFSRPICIAENVYHDICVSDCKKYQITVVDNAGKFRFSYDGKYPSQDFEPTEIGTDSVGNFLVCDPNNSIIHLISCDGKTTRHLLTKRNGMEIPWGLDIDSKDRLWIAEYQSGKVKSFQYLKDK